MTASLPSADRVYWDGHPDHYDERPGQQRGGRSLSDTDTVAIWVRPLVVDTTADESDGDFSTGDLSLREAIELTNANPGADEIAFAAALAGSTITLTSGELAITEQFDDHTLGVDQLTITATTRAGFSLSTTESGRRQSPLQSVTRWKTATASLVGPSTT